MILLENEVKLDALTNKDQLTSLRVLLEYSNFGGSYRNSIFLEKISSIEVHYKSKPVYIILAVIVFILGIWAQSEIRRDGEVALIACLFVSILFIVAFFLTRKYTVSITPDGGKSIDIEAKGLSEERIEQFIANIQEAKLARTMVTTAL